MSVLSILLGYQLKKERKKEKCCSEESLQNILGQQSSKFVQEIKLYNDIECWESRTSIHE